MKKSISKKVYFFFNTDDKNVDEHLPRNYFLLLISSIFTKLGDTLSNPKTVLTWVMNYINAPVYMISFIVPIRESGSMLPQIFLASYIKTKAKRKWIYVFGSIFQFASILAIGLTAYFFEGVLAGSLIILFLIIFSLSRSLCSVSSKDVLGKTIPKDRRGKLKGYTVSVSGVLVLLAGLFMMYKSKSGASLLFYSGILVFASAMWLISAFIYSKIKEDKSKIQEHKNTWKEVIQRIKIVKKDTHFRNFIIARSLLLCSALTAPFYVLLAQENIGKESYLLGLFIIANGVASILSAPVWGKMADVSSKNVMSFATIIASALGITMFIIIEVFTDFSKIFWLYPVAFFILGIAHSGVRLGRKTYVVNMAEGNKRTDYVAVSNTIIGLILLVTGGISALASLFSVELVLLVLSIFGILGAFLSYKLPNVEAE
ncbi:MFS transporter [Polaribacter aestuariivivens]|uniref:MFS transporter n=1 Tax=Polaribacter aestuariivivens TaxID=2304626 RepID=A0A5S3N7B4_9FLAO|nr:MFS transporter [Polaribacter aestuariivivens]TMM31200.1 MFS transporter [Polaribacter aestuariivivens]